MENTLKINLNIIVRFKVTQDGALALNQSRPPAGDIYQAGDVFEGHLWQAMRRLGEKCADGATLIEDNTIQLVDPAEIEVSDDGLNKRIVGSMASFDQLLEMFKPRIDFLASVCAAFVDRGFARSEAMQLTAQLNTYMFDQMIVERQMEAGGEADEV